MVRVWLCGTLLSITLACDSKSDPGSSSNLDASPNTDVSVSAVAATSAVSTAGAFTVSDESSASVGTTSQTPIAATHVSSDNDSESTLSPDAGTETTSTAEVSDAGTPKVVSCDPRGAICRRAVPPCDYGFVPRIVDGCFGDCVAIDTCTCDEPEACPQSERYTCNNSRNRCTPYLN